MQSDARGHIEQTYLHAAFLKERFDEVLRELCPLHRERLDLQERQLLCRELSIVCLEMGALIRREQRAMQAVLDALRSPPSPRA
ncbi:MAG: hypothetical protein ACR2M3_11995 [Thermomicrobiales bacterium]